MSGDLCLGIANTVLRLLLPRIGFVMPSESGGDLHQIHIESSKQDSSNDPAIPVALVPIDRDAPLKDRIGKALPRALPESLPLLGRIDSFKANPVLCSGFVEERQRIAVADPDDLTGQGGRAGMRRQRQDEKNEGPELKP